jgi:hypothetical protein
VQLTATTGEPAIEWATREFAEKLGIADLFLFDDVPAGGVSSGGGQLMTCRDLARVGSLLVQGGKWADASGNFLGELPWRKQLELLGSSC